jgi:putative membrane protein
MKMLRYGSAAALTLLVLVFTSQAADREPATELEFLAKAITTDMNEVKLGELALKHASSDDVRQYARKIISDHSKHQDELLERAKVRKLAVVQGLEKDQQENMDRLSMLDGKEFDREYMKCMVEGHEKALRMYQTWSKKIEDRDLSSLVDRTLPTLKEHLEKARDVSSKVKR